MKFEEINAYHSNSGHYVTNEQPEIHLKHLETITDPIERSAAIASGGEIPLFVLLPRTRGEVVCIDHSVYALTAFYLKLLTLKNKGWKETKRLMLEPPIVDPNRSPLLKAFSQAFPEVPAPLQAFLNKTLPARSGSLAPSEYFLRVHLSFYITFIQKEWSLIPDDTMELVEKSLDRLTILHGDIKDLMPRGPFDLLYTSNIHEHVSRNGTPGFEFMEPIVRPGGWIFGSTTSPIFYGKAPVGRDIKIKPIPRLGDPEYASSRTMNWNYFLYRTPEQVEERKTA